MVNHAQDFVAVKKYEILQYSLIPSDYQPMRGQYSDYQPMRGQYCDYQPMRGQYSDYQPMSGQYSSDYQPMRGQYDLEVSRLREVVVV